MRSKYVWLTLAALLALLTAAPVAAQTDGEIDDPTAPQAVEEVIHGFYTHARMGLQTYVAGPVAEDTARASGMGLSTGFGLGYDIFDWFALELNVTFGVNSRESRPSDLQSYEILGSNIPTYGAQLRLNFAFPFTERFRLAGNLGGGVLTTFNNEKVFGASEWVMGAGGVQELKIKKTIDAAVLPMFGVAVGVEYYTSLRHFSVGFMIEYFHVFQGVDSGGLAFLPTLKYTF